MARRSTAIKVQRAEERYESRGEGVVSRHCFSAGAHYDPANVAFGSLTGVDEHVLEPGAGFGEHAHAGVVIVSWVVSGVLAHDATTAVRPGEALVQVTGNGITHTERNGSATEPLRLVQMTLLDERPSAPAVWTAPVPVHVPGGLLSLVTDRVLTEGPTFCFCLSGRFLVDPKEVLGPGDSLRAEDPLSVQGSGELLVWTLPPFRQPVLPRTKPPRRRLFPRP